VEQNAGRPVKDMPGALEGIHFLVESLRAAYSGRVIIRRRGKVATLDPIEWNAAPEAEGRWANLLPRTRGVREGVN